MSQQLIKIDYTKDQPTVSARELYEGLEIKSNFTTWFDRMCEYGFSEKTDFNFSKKGKVQLEGEREVKRELCDYEISIDMAKQICMIQRTDKGKEYRQYFIDLEKAWNTPEQIMARARIDAVCNRIPQEMVRKLVEEYLGTEEDTDETV